MLVNDVRDYLIAQGAAPSGWVAYIGILPDDQDQAITITATGGYPAEELNRENELVTFQLRVRAGKLDYQTGSDKWKECFNLLQDARQVAGSPVLLPGVAFIQAMQYGENMQPDPKGRPNFFTNFRCKRVYS